MKKYTLAIALLVIIGNNLFSQHQPEYTGFETVENRDMVNLSTGDFVYNVPIITVPGPDGGYTVPLTYYGGIKLEQEASWVGLGWNMSVGAINRSISGYPDDFKGEIQEQHTNAVGSHGWVKNYILFNSSWDSERGSGGSVSLLGLASAGWGTQSHFSTMGVEFRDGKVSVDPVSIAASALSVVSANTTGVLSEITSSVKSVYSAMNSALSYAQTVSQLVNANNVTSMGYWRVHTRGFFNMRYKSYLNVDKELYQYGTLYLSDVPIQKNLSGSINRFIVAGLYVGAGPDNGTVNTSDNGLTSYKSSPILENNPDGSATATGVETHVHDMHMYVNGDNYNYSIEPVSLAPDKYTVMGDGVSGSIHPYRFETASLANVNVDPYHHRRFKIGNWRGTKAQFKYVNQLENYYTYHEPENGNVGIEYKEAADGDAYLLVNDDKIYTAPVETRGINEGFDGTKFQAAKYIAWYSNFDIKNSSFSTYAFMDFLPQTERYEFRNQLTSHGIGGFAITNESGITYHYALPVYNNNSYTEFRNTVENSLTTHVENNKYAITWLLTGITGPDFLDNGNGYIDENDYGYWVKFNYGKFAESYEYRIPYETDTYNYSATDINNEYYSSGNRQTYYLDEIKTRSHTAIFLKSERLDGKSAGAFASSSLKLDQIVILTNKNYDELVNNVGLKKINSLNGGSTNNLYANVWDVEDLSTNEITSYIKTNKVNKVQFNYSYSLCKGALNSFNASTPHLKYGKLTLSSVQTFGKNNFYFMPAYHFDYYEDDPLHNPNYNKYAFDGWGMYNGNKVKDISNHISNTEGDEWSLKEITLPVGGKIKVEYERDSYDNASGYPVNTSMKLSGQFNAQTGELFLDSPIDPRNYCNVGDKINLFASAKQDCDIYYKDGMSGDYWGRGKENLIIDKEQTIVALSSNSITIGTLPQVIDDYLDRTCDEAEGTCIIHGGKRDCYWFSVEGYFSIVEPNKSGGDIRVKTISLENSQDKYVTRYEYSNGACSLEPEFCRTPGLSLYEDPNIHLLDYPFTPVIYGKVSMLSDYNQGDYTEKTDYRFITPSYDMVKVHKNMQIDEDRFRTYKVHPKVYDIDVEVNTSQIGQIVDMLTWNKFNDLLMSKSYSYTSDINAYEGMGHYTEGNILCENIYSENIHWLRLFRTVKKYKPNILTQIRTKTSNSEHVTYFSKYDKLSGQLIEENTTSNKEQISKSILLAHKVYPWMGSKHYDESYGNMLNQTAGIITKKDGKVLDVNIQTWTFNSDYLIWDEVERCFLEEAYQGTELIFRKDRTYSWTGNIDSEGYYDSQEFMKYSTVQGIKDNWYKITGGVNHHDPRWVKTGQVTRYDHYSTPVEVMDINGDYAATKKDANNMYTVASAANARHSQFAHCGFEYGSNQNQGEAGVYIQYPADITKSNSERTAHTGDYYLSVGATKTGASYKIPLQEAAGYEYPLSFIASVWHYSAAGDLPGPLYLSINGPGAGGTIKGERFGNWVLYTRTFKLETAPQSDIVFSVSNSDAQYGTTIYIDDFRVSPYDAAVTSYTYNNAGSVTSISGSNNIATKYEYDDAGRLKASYVEKPTGFEKVSAYNYNTAVPLENTDVSISTHGFSYDEPGMYVISSSVSFDNKNKTPVTTTVDFTFDGGSTEKVTKTISPQQSATFKHEIFVSSGWTGNKLIAINNEYWQGEFIVLSPPLLMLSEPKIGFNLPASANTGDVISNLKCEVTNEGNVSGDGILTFVLSKYTDGREPLASISQGIMLERSQTSIITAPDLTIPDVTGVSGSYYLVIMSNTGDVINSSTHISITSPPPPPPPIEFSVTINYDKPSSAHELTATPVNANGSYTYSYQWTTTDGDIRSGETSATMRTYQDGTYIVDVTASNGYTSLQKTQSLKIVNGAPEYLPY